MTFLGYCSFEDCGQPVDSTYNAARLIKCWEPLRAQGGGNHPKARVELGQVAHVTCIDRHEERSRRGIAREQESLL